MVIGCNTISTWNEMKKEFLQKYHEYCRTPELREDFFKITQKEEENLEDFVARF